MPLKAICFARAKLSITLNFREFTLLRPPRLGSNMKSSCKLARTWGTQDVLLYIRSRFPLNSSEDFNTHQLIQIQQLRKETRLFVKK